MDRNPVLHPIPDTGGHVFAIRIDRLATLTALGFQGAEYYRELFKRHVDWLTCLMNSRDERITYDLRLISTPNPELYVRGSLKLALLCRLDGFTQDEARDYSFELLRLNESSFEDEYEFSIVDDVQELHSLLRAFDVAGAARICRRSELSGLDAVTARPHRSPAGFAQNPATRATEPERAVYHVYPFLPALDSRVPLFKLLLMQTEPLAVSFRLRPTALEPSEVRFLEEQIIRCERYAQISIGQAGDNLEAIHPTLQEQARVFQRRLIRSLYALKDNAALLQVEVLGPRAIPQTVVDVLGGHLTQPAGAPRLGESLEAYLSGGYEYTHLRGEPLKRAAEAAATLDFALETDANSTRCISPDTPVRFSRSGGRVPPACSGSGACAGFRCEDLTHPTRSAAHG